MDFHLIFPKMLMHYLKDATHQAKMNLPYGMALTKIFLDSGINIFLGEPKQVLKHTDFYIVGTLSRMGFKKEDEKWTRKITFAPIPLEVPPLAPMAPRTSTSPPSLPPMSPLPHFLSPPSGLYQTYPDP